VLRIVRADYRADQRMRGVIDRESVLAAFAVVEFHPLDLLGINGDAAAKANGKTRSVEAEAPQAVDVPLHGLLKIRDGRRGQLIDAAAIVGPAEIAVIQGDHHSAVGKIQSIKTNQRQEEGIVSLGYIDFDDFRYYPDKARIEHIAKRHNTLLLSLVGLDGLDFTHGGMVITLYNGDLGWSYDRSGINELPAPAVTDFQEAMKRNVDSLLRFRLNEPGLTIRFGGSDTVDLKQVQWV